MSVKEVGFKKYIIWFWAIVLASLLAAFLFFYLLSNGILGSGVCLLLK